MTLAVGKDWIRQWVLEQMRTAWQEGNESNPTVGEAEQRLFAYADLTGYVAIIICKDSLRDVFGEVFQREHAVEESFQLR